MMRRRAEDIALTVICIASVSPAIGQDIYCGNEVPALALASLAKGMREVATRVYPNRGKPTRILTEFWSSAQSWPGAKMPETAEHGFWHSTMCQNYMPEDSQK